MDDSTKTYTITPEQKAFLSDLWLTVNKHQGIHASFLLGLTGQFAGGMLAIALSHSVGTPDQAKAILVANINIGFETGVKHLTASSNSEEENAIGTPVGNA